MGRFHATTAMYVSWVVIYKRLSNGRMKCGCEPLDLHGVWQFDNIQLILHQVLEGLDSWLVKVCEGQQSKWHAMYEREEITMSPGTFGPISIFFAQINWPLNVSKPSSRPTMKAETKRGMEHS
jgi:hypothetical protein